MDKTSPNYSLFLAKTKNNIFNNNNKNSIIIILFLYNLLLICIISKTFYMINNIL